MEQTVSISEKRAFLKWFLRRFELKSRECVWLLNYILSVDHTVNLLRFVDNVVDCPRAMIVSEKHTPDPPFIYRVRNVVTEQPEKAFHDLRLNTDEPVYIRLIFPDASRSAEYAAVLEENPYERADLERRFGEEAERVLNRACYLFQKNQLSEEIDRALDARDQDRFRALSSEWRSVQEKLRALGDSDSENR